jgi:CRISPR type III-B/RAMP module-associated protein Cmr3
MQPTSRPVLQDPIGLLIQPHDTLFFRDGRPFGPTDTGRSQLALPQTVAGMLRTHLAHSLGLDSPQMHWLRENASGIGLHQRALAFIACRGPWLVKMESDSEIEDLFVPAPAHLCRLDKDKKQLTLLRPLEDETPLPGWRNPQSQRQKHLRPLLYKGSESMEPEKRWLGINAVRAVLRGEIPKTDDLNESTSAMSRVKCRIKTLELDPGVRGCEVPVDS